MKSNKPTETLRIGKLPKPEAVKQAEEVPGAAAKCIKEQCGLNGRIGN